MAIGGQTEPCKLTGKYVGIRIKNKIKEVHYEVKKGM
jgi:hypothetical protein